MTIRSLQAKADRPDKSGRISGYDELIRNQAESRGLDWRLVAALVYQESRFDPQAVSSAGAIGLMQVVPDFAADQADSLFDPGANVRAGLRLLKGTYDGFAYLDSLERIRFTLAVYHAGYGHVTDARRIAMDLGRDPDLWAGSLDDALPRLMERSWYGESRHGFYRGAETVRYVEEIMNRFAMYARFVPRFGPLPPLAETPDDEIATPE
jgi:membrane-bound lytic murein transglycosylase F